MKILKIEKCIDCTHYYVDVVFDKECNLTGKELIRNKPIPEWCPLEDVTQQAVTPDAESRCTCEFNEPYISLDCPIHGNR